jgi:AraC-like DNA-binding protein
MSLLHSVPAVPRALPCETLTAPPDRRLRPYVIGYSGFSSGDGRPVRHRVLPVTLTTLIIDIGGAARVVTGPRDAPTVHTETAWATGVTVGLTPAGVSTLLGVPVPELVGATVRLADLLGRVDADLADRLHAATDWPARFALLDEALAARVERPRPPHPPWRASALVPPDPLVQAAFVRLHRPDAPGVGALAGRLGVSRRYLELGFRRLVGLSPGTVARIARFQRAVGLLARRADPSRTAAECGYADQPHLSRDVRQMAGVTPTELFALLQYRELTAPYRRRS